MKNKKIVIAKVRKNKKNNQKQITIPFDSNIEEGDVVEIKKVVLK